MLPIMEFIATELIYTGTGKIWYHLALPSPKHDSVVADLGPGCVRVDQDTAAGAQGSAFGSKHRLAGVEGDTRSNLNHRGRTHC